MNLRVLRLVTLLCAALVMGLAFAHVLELPRKMTYSADEYERIQHSLYAYFAYVGGPLEVLAIVLAASLAFAVRRERNALRWSLAGAILLAAGLAEWAAVVQTANTAMARWTIGAMPANWTQTRDQWEFGHLGHFLLFAAGFLALLWSSLARQRQV